MVTEPVVEPWWQSLYDDVVAEVFLVRRDPDELQATVAFLRDHLGLDAGKTLFDQCCGIGSLAVPLARAGIRIVGVDQCASYIARARGEANQSGLPCDFHHADAFTFVPNQPMDAAVNWGTSFGNADDERNREMLLRAFQTLRPGGRFALDYQHVPRVLRTFQPCLLHRLTREGEETIILRESELDLPQGTLRQRWMLLFSDGRRLLRQSVVRLYLPAELAAMVRACGFEEITFHGGVRGEALSLDSPRCILVARRPLS